jgi:hypothetical protein
MKKELILLRGSIVDEYMAMLAAEPSHVRTEVRSFAALRMTFFYSTEYEKRLRRQVEWADVPIWKPPVVEQDSGIK